MKLRQPLIAAFLTFLVVLGWHWAIADSALARFSPVLPQVAQLQKPQPQLGIIALKNLPAEAKATIHLIQKGGPFPYAKDGTVFGNRERRLPIAAAGYYREYTVRTPGVQGRGARRIVMGGNRAVYYYTSNHYQSFARVKF